MIEIIEYTDYRKFIQDYYDERKRTSAFTWRDFARDAGFSSAVYLKYVCEGKKNLSIGAAGSVAAAMGLVGFEQTYFVLLVSYAHAKSDETKRAAFEERCALAHAHKIRVLGNEEFNYFKSWKNPVLRVGAAHARCKAARNGSCLQAENYGGGSLRDTRLFGACEAPEKGS